MLKKILLSIFVFLNILIFFIKFIEKKPEVGLEIISKNIQQKSVDHYLIDVFNERNKLIQNFICDDINVKVWTSSGKINLKSKIYYQKSLNFKMEFFSFLGKEIDIGSNQDFFWYWSKRDKFPGVYWSRHEDFQKTRLKTPFDPFFLKTTLGLDVVDLSNCNILENQNLIMIIFYKKNSLDEIVSYSLLLNKKSKNFEGLIIKNTKGETLACCEIKSRHKNGLPAEVIYHWYEENQTMVLKFVDPKTNQTLDGQMFEMPNYKPKINMAEE